MRGLFIAFSKYIIQFLCDFYLFTDLLVDLFILFLFIYSYEVPPLTSKFRHAYTDDPTVRDGMTVRGAQVQISLKFYLWKVNR